MRPETVRELLAAAASFGGPFTHGQFARKAYPESPGWRLPALRSDPLRLGTSALTIRLRRLQPAISNVALFGDN